MKKIFSFLFLLSSFSFYAQNEPAFSVTQFGASYKTINESSSDSMLQVLPTIQIVVSDYNMFNSLYLKVSDATTQNQIFDFAYAKQATTQTDEFNLIIVGNTIKIEYKKTVFLKPYQYELIFKNNSDEIIYQYLDLK